MGDLPLIVGQINERLARIERHLDAQDVRLREINGRINRWAGVLTVAGGLGGVALSVAAAFIRSHWTS